jgi:hypothetical protein
MFARAFAVVASSLRGSSRSFSLALVLSELAAQRHRQGREGV